MHLELIKRGIKLDGEFLESLQSEIPCNRWFTEISEFTWKFHNHEDFY